MRVTFMHRGEPHQVELGRDQISLLSEHKYISQVNGNWFGASFKDAMQFLIEHPSVMVCDFCGGKPIRWIYECKPLHTVVVGVQDVHQDWAACEPCAAAVEENNSGELAWRAWSGHVKRNPEVEDDDKAFAAGMVMISTLHEAFFAHRTGTRQPV